MSGENSGSAGEKTEPSNAIIEGLHRLGVGILSILGILMPGAWFCATATFYFTHMPGYEKILGNRLPFETILTSAEFSLKSYLFLGMLGIVIYVTGAVLRILPVDFPDMLSMMLATITNSGKEIDWKERYPYESLRSKYLNKRELHGIASLVPWGSDISPNSAKQIPRSKTFLHYIKLYIGIKNPKLAQLMTRDEALVRLLSGIFYAVLLSSAVFLFGLHIMDKKESNTPILPRAIAAAFFFLLYFDLLLKFHSDSWETGIRWKQSFEQLFEYVSTNLFKKTKRIDTENNTEPEDASLEEVRLAEQRLELPKDSFLHFAVTLVASLVFSFLLAQTFDRCFPIALNETSSIGVPSWLTIFTILAVLAWCAKTKVSRVRQQSKSEDCSENNPAPQDRSNSNYNTQEKQGSPTPGTLFFLSMIFAFGLQILLAFMNPETRKNTDSASTMVFLFNLFLTLGILKAFHFQRLRELFVQLCAYHLVGEPENSPYQPPANEKFRMLVNQKQLTTGKGTTPKQPSSSG